jgi:hypothetical protein
MTKTPLTELAARYDRETARLKETALSEIAGLQRTLASLRDDIAAGMTPHMAAGSDSFCVIEGATKVQAAAGKWLTYAGEAARVRELTDLEQPEPVYPAGQR